MRCRVVVVESDDQARDAERAHASTLGITLRADGTLAPSSRSSYR
jgi:hypothetical protein